MTHYDTLGVSRWAEDAVIRAAYRALMRIYHPDTNTDLEAQARVREINAAYSVLGNRSKRAQYDSLPNLFDEPSSPKQPVDDADRQSHSPRKLGIASIALLLVTSLAVIAVPELRQPFRSPQLPKPTSTAIRASAPSVVPVVRAVIVPRASVAVSAKATAVAPKSLAVPPAVAPSSMSAPRPTPEISRAAVTRAAALPRRSRVADISGKAVMASKPLLVPSATTRKPKFSSAEASNARATRPETRCGISNASSGECLDERKSLIERIATNFLKQSLSHSDWHKQQLLLSAQNRSTFSRATCHSDQCVINAYMEQMRDTSIIMQGGIPTR